MEQRKLGKYEIRATLGRGAMGVVYQAWDPGIDRRVAIKTVRLPDDDDAEATGMLSRCKREAQAAGRLSHPNIVGVFDYGETDELAYIVMEYIDGRTLKAVLDSGERLAPAEILRVMTALLAGLQYSHDNGVVHRDIKPANVMLTGPLPGGQGQVKIADFGIARIDSSNMTQVGTVMGTPAYMSPEQFMGHTADRRTDIYSAGVLLYQLVTGERPFEGSISGIMHKALNTEPPRPSTRSVVAPAALDAVVAKAMAKRPEDRFASADEFSRALRAAFADAAVAADDVSEATVVAVRRPVKAAGAETEGVAAKPRSAAGPTPRTGRSVGVPAVGVPAVRVLAASVGLLVLAGAGGAAWYLAGRHPAEQLAERPPAAAVVTAPTVAPTVAPIRPPPELVSPPPVAAPSQGAAAPPVVAPAEAPAAAPVAAPATTTAMREPEQGTPAAAAAASLLGLAEARALALDIPCSLIDVSETRSVNIKSRLRVSGPMLPGADFDRFIGQLRGPDRLLDVTTDRLESGQCDALAAVAELVRHSRERGRLRLVTPDGPVEVGGRLAVTVGAAPEGTLSIDLHAADGSVQHWMRRTIAAGGGDDHLSGPAPGPPGERLLVAIATATPLALAQRPAAESDSAYLPVLRGELARAAAEGSEPRVEIAIVSIRAAPRPAAAVSAATSARLRLPGLNDTRCADIVSRIQLGEALSDADRSVLQSSCRR